MGGNRFILSILDGTIGSIAELKAAYKNEAKRTHPDLSDAGGHDAFLKLRTEYEHALRELSRGPKNDPSTEMEAGTERAAADADPYEALELLLKRGFPKKPRHRKEILRYRYARLRARSALAALDPQLPELFDAMERELLEAEGEKGTEAVVRLMEDKIKAVRAGSEVLSAAAVMELGRLFPPTPLGGGGRQAPNTAAPEAAAPRPGTASEAFCRSLIKR